MISTNKIKDQISTVLEQANFKGSFLAANREGIIYTGSYGLANAELNVRNTTSTKFRIGSLTKQFTALSILQLVENNYLTVNDTLDRFIPEYPSGKEITIHQLLSHSSGIYNFSNRSDIMEWYKSSMTIKETIDSFQHQPTSFNPGEKYEYSNSNYVLLTYIIEQVSGLSYEVYLQNNIFNVLGMNDTGYDNESEIIINRATGYYYKDEILNNAPYINMSIPQGAGGLYSTIEDLYKWDRALYGDNLLGEKIRADFFTPKIESYAYGWMVQYFGNMKVLFHTGGIHGFSSFICRFPEEQVCVIALNNYSQDISGIAVQVSQMILR